MKIKADFGSGGMVGVCEYGKMTYFSAHSDFLLFRVLWMHHAGGWSGRRMRPW